MAQGKPNFEESYCMLQVSVLPEKYSFLEGKIINITIAITIGTKFQKFINISSSEIVFWESSKEKNVIHTKSWSSIPLKKKLRSSTLKNETFSQEMHLKKRAFKQGFKIVKS
jgi:hypothetical protein